jgi:hypothetical protein
MACRVLVSCHGADWSSQVGESTLRAYWVCVLSEAVYHLHLDLPQTGIHLLQDEVPLPKFSTSTGPSRAGVEDSPYYQYHFLASITLRRLIISIDAAVHEGISSIGLDSGGTKLTVSQHLRSERSPQTTTVAHPSR